MNQPTWHILVVVALLALVTSGLVAQDDPVEAELNRLRRWCIPPDIAPTPETPQLECEAYISCVLSSHSNNCYFDSFIELLNWCEAESQNNCFDFAVMNSTYFAAIGSHAATYDLFFMAFDPENDYSDSLEQYTLAVDVPNFVTELAHAVILKNQGDLQAAIEAINESIRLQTLNPIAYYIRGNIYLNLSMEDRAARDFYTYSILAPENLLDILPTPESIFSMPDNSEEWLLYPVFSRGISPGPITLNDLTHLAPTSVTISLIDENTFASINLVDYSRSIDGGITFLHYIDPNSDIVYPYYVYEDDQRAYRYFAEASSYVEPFSDWGSDGYSVTIVGNDDMYSAYSEIERFESGYYSHMILLHTDDQDPRQELERPCEGLPMSYLRLGDKLTDSDGFNMIYLDLYHEPDGEKIMINDYFSFGNWWRENDHPNVVVTDGPVCGEEYVWWQINSDEQVGWIPDQLRVLPDELFTQFAYGPLPTLEELIELSHRVERSNE